MKRSIKIALISQALLICIMAASSEALSISILSPSPEEQVLESGRDFYVIGRIDREGLAPGELPFDIRVDVAETGLVRDGKIIPVRTVKQCRPPDRLTPERNICYRYEGKAPWVAIDRETLSKFPPRHHLQARRS